MSNTLLRMENIDKRFPGVHALKNACLDLREGEVLGLMGENGAGKSTLMNVLGGIYRADSGNIFIDGEEVAINSVLDAQAMGIAFIHQELALEPHLTVAENIFLGREIKNQMGLVSRRLMNREARKYLNIVGLDIKPQTKVSYLSTGKQQMLEIAKAFSLKARIIVMDEPTSSLSEKEVNLFFETVRDLRKRGIGIIYISHKMQEIFDLTDRVIVMRDGAYIGSRITKETNPDELVRMMVGRELKSYYMRTFNEPGETVLEVRHVSSGLRVKDCSFSVKRGEILGFYGLVGAGRSELMQTVMGLDAIDGGEVVLNGEATKKPKPDKNQKRRLVMVPESRKTQGLILGGTVAFNTTLVMLDRFIKNLKVNYKAEKGLARRAVRDYNIKTPSIKQKVLNLSGGNQQKTVLAKWLLTDPEIIIMDEPTRGIDVGAKAEVYAIMNNLVSSGKAIIMVSSELNEIINMCDRVLVMHEGRIVAELNKDEFEQDAILHYALGGTTG